MKANEVLDIKIEAEAKARAQRAKEYAARCPQFIKPGEQVFQNHKWQYKALERYQSLRQKAGLST